MGERNPGEPTLSQSQIGFTVALEVDTGYEAFSSPVETHTQELKVIAVNTTNIPTSVAETYTESVNTGEQEFVALANNIGKNKSKGADRKSIRKDANERARKEIRSTHNIPPGTKVDRRGGKDYVWRNGRWVPL